MDGSALPAGFVEVGMLKLVPVAEASFEEVIATRGRMKSVELKRAVRAGATQADSKAVGASLGMG